MDELDGNVLRVGALAAGSEDHQLAAAVKPHRHGVARGRYRPGLLGELKDGRRPALEQRADLIVVGARRRQVLVRAHAAAPCAPARSISISTSTASRTLSDPRNAR